MHRIHNQQSYSHQHFSNCLYVIPSNASLSIWTLNQGHAAIHANTFEQQQLYNFMIRKQGFFYLFVCFFNKVIVLTCCAVMLIGFTGRYLYY